MRYPAPLSPGDTIGVCAPSAGVSSVNHVQLDRAIEAVRQLGYAVVETPSVRQGAKAIVSADAGTRAREFMQLYEDPRVKAILPPWGGEFLMDMLPLLDLEAIAALPPKWVSGYSDITTLTFALTLRCDMATLHGSNLLNMGFGHIHQSDRAAFEAMASTEGITQQSAGVVGTFDRCWDDPTAPPYAPTRPWRWENLCGEAGASFSGRVLGGCMDVICKLLGTAYAPVEAFIARYGAGGIVWTLESCEMSPMEVYRTLWQMRQSGWFASCSGVIIGRADNCAPHRGYALRDALLQSFEGMGVPVLYEADIGHIPPQVQLINGAAMDVAYRDGAATLAQRYAP